MESIKKWVWQHQDYPNFPYDFKELDNLLIKTARYVGILEGSIRALDGKYSQNIKINSATDEILSTSRIEGEILRRDSVRSSVLKRLASFQLKDDRSTRHTDGLVDVLVDSSSNHDPLTPERLHGWHNALFPTGYSGFVKIRVASYRQEDMRVVSNMGTKERVHYQAPPPECIEKEMKKFLDYVNHSTINPYIKSAISHLWFVIIHPYDDGNGRIARAIANYVLSKDLKLNCNYFSISSAVMRDRKRYYEILERSNNLFYNRDYDFTPWIYWHTDMIYKAIEHSLKTIEIVLQKAKFWDRASKYSLNEKQIKVLNKLLDAGEDNFQGGLTNKKYQRITGVAQVTASRHIKDLVQKGLLREMEGFGGRNTRYEIVWE